MENEDCYQVADLKAAREAARMSIKELAMRSGLGQCTVIRYETMAYGPPWPGMYKVEIVQRLSKTIHAYRAWFETVYYGETLQTMRQKASMTQAELARQAKVDHKTVFRYEDAFTDFPDPVVLQRMANVLNDVLAAKVQTTEPQRMTTPELRAICAKQQECIEQACADLERGVDPAIVVVSMHAVLRRQSVREVG